VTRSEWFLLKGTNHNQAKPSKQTREKREERREKREVHNRAQLLIACVGEGEVKKPENPSSLQQGQLQKGWFLERERTSYLSKGIHPIFIFFVLYLGKASSSSTHISSHLHWKQC